MSGKRFFGWVGSFSIEALPEFLMFLFLLAAPCWLKWSDDGSFHLAKVTGICSTFIALWIAGIFTFLSLLPALGRNGLRKAGQGASPQADSICRNFGNAASRQRIAAFSTIWKWVVALFLWFLCFIEFFIFFVFKSRFTERIVSLMMQTDAAETSGFFSTFVFTWKTIFIAVALIAAAMIFYYIGHLLRSALLKGDALAHKCGIGIAVLIVGLASMGVYAAYAVTGIFFEQFSHSSVSQYVESFRTFGSQSKRLDAVTAEVRNAGAYIADEEEAPEHLMWVIGESYNKYHAGVYGYGLPTTPNLQKALESGNLIVFKDAVTPSAATDEVMEYIFFAHNYGNSRNSKKLKGGEEQGGADWGIISGYNPEEYPLMPALFKRAGYRVELHDNQTTRAAGASKWDINNLWFFNSEEIERLALDYRNNDMSRYDGDFVEHELAATLSVPRKLSIYHLKGQHMPARNLYPERERHFTPADYASRRDLNESQKETVAQYDDATLYNDKVLGRLIESVEGEDAIIVYHSDHGEEVYDFRDQYGRTLEPPTPQIRRNVWEVPMVIYVTNTFKSRHPEMVKRLQQASEKRYFTADIANLLLEIGHVKTQ